MYCPNCGNQIPDGAKFCPGCGASTDGRYGYNTPSYGEDSGSIGWAFLGFFFPIVGLILYLVWRNEKPRSAKRAGTGALVAVILYVVLFVLYIVIAVVALSSLTASLNELARTASLL